MEDLSKYTDIELNKKMTDISVSHDLLKQEVINLTFEVDELEKKINQKLEAIQELEKNYVEIVEEISKR